MTRDRWPWPRRVLAAAGLAALAFGAQQLLTGGRATALGSSVPWLAAVLVVHDAVLAPALAGAAWLLRRGLPARARWALPAVAAGLLVGGSLTLIAAVALAAPGLPDNPTVLPRDYARGLAVLLAADLLVTAGVLLIALLGRLSGRRAAGVRRGEAPGARGPAGGRPRRSIRRPSRAR